MNQEPLRTGATGLVAAVLLAAAASHSDLDPSDSPQSLGTILVVDNDPVLRMLLAKFLVLAGYTAFEAPVGSAALQLARHHPGRIDLLITDVMMPGMSGFELAEAFVDLHPEARVLYMSGHVHDMPDVGKAVQASPDSFMVKPFWAEQLLEKVQGMLPGPGAGRDS